MTAVDESAVAALATARSPATENTMTSWDGAELFYRAWLPATPSDKALILFVIV